MKTLIKQYKQQLKQLAKTIRSMKGERKSAENGYVPGLMRARQSFRLKHIAYCLLRGRTLEQIEKYPTTIREDKNAWKEVEKLMLGVKMYVLVRRDLTKSQQTVQACHAVSSFFRGRPPEARMKSWNHTKVILGVEDAKELMEWYRKFPIFKNGIALFREPDLGGYPTAFSVLLQGDEGELLKNLNLL